MTGQLACPQGFGLYFMHTISFYFFIFLLFFFFRAPPEAYGGSQPRSLIGATAAGLHHSHSNNGSLTHGVRPGIEPATSWFLDRFVSTAPWKNTHNFISNHTMIQKVCVASERLCGSLKLRRKLKQWSRDGKQISICRGWEKGTMGVTA